MRLLRPTHRGMTRWHVYLIRRGDGALYTGITTAVSRRFAQHRESGPRGAKCLRGKGPLTLVFSRAVGGRGLALRVEDRIKCLPKARKEGLILEVAAFDAIVAEARRVPSARRVSSRRAAPG